jgi:malonyl-CoA/methylmalonyl-CoA synthetase
MSSARFLDASAAPGAPDAQADYSSLIATITGLLGDLDVAPGDRVVLSCDPSVSTVAAYAAILRVGAVVVPANTGYTRRELEHVVGDVRPVLALASDPARFDGLVPALDPLRGEGRRRSGDVEAPHGGARSDGELGGEVLGSSDAPAMIAFTSGTTGAPKGAVLSHANLRASAESVAKAWHWTADDTLVLALPLFHMHGLGVGVNGTLVTGGSAVVLPQFSPDAVFDAIAEHRATLFFGVPTMYARLADHPRLPELAGVRLCVSGSAPLAPTLWQRIVDGSGQRVLERYGMSETAMLTSNPYEGQRRPGTVGLPLPGVEVRLGAGDGVEVRGPNVFGGYWERPDASAAAFTQDGWFRTGDVGAFDDDGYLSLVGRQSELIITGGYNVYPREVEDVLRAHPQVDDAAVVGVPDDAWGERVVAFVVTRDGARLDTGSVDAHCVAELAPYKRPRDWRPIEALPRNAMGKIRRDELVRVASTDMSTSKGKNE